MSPAMKIERPISAQHANIAQHNGKQGNLSISIHKQQSRAEMTGSRTQFIELPMLPHGSEEVILVML
jgi:hypothetical protein